MFKALGSLVKNTEVIGLDIGTHSIKMVEIDHRKTGMVLNTFATIAHSISLDGYWNSTTLREIATKIDKMMAKSNFVGIKTVLSIRSRDVYVTTMDFDPSLSESSIKAEINRQAPFFLPLPPEQMRLSYDLINTPTLGGKKRVVINATPDHVVENSRNLLEHLNLDGEAIENATLSQIRSVLSKNNETVILVDLGAWHTVLSTVVNGNLRSSTYIPQGTQQIASEIGSLIGTTNEIGEEFMRDLNLVDLAHLPKPFLDYLDVLKDEISIFIGLNEKVGQKATKIVFTGGGSLTPGIIEYLSTLPLAIQMGDPLSDLTIDKELIPYISPVANQMSVAIGLAKRADIL